MKINKHEIEIVGHWVLEDSRMIADHNCQRIEMLTTKYLIKIAIDDSGWDLLYKDPEDSRYWEYIYPHSEMHGGGPPSLKMLTGLEAKSKYNIPNTK